MAEAEGRKKKKTVLFNEYKVSVWDNENVLEIDSGNGKYYEGTYYH